MKGIRHIKSNLAFLVVLSLLIKIQNSSASKIIRKTKIGTVRTKKTRNVNIVTTRKLKKKKHSNPHPRHSFDEVNSCLNYSCEELEALWRFPGKMPDCPGLNCNGSSVTSDNSGSGTSSEVSGGTSTSGENGNHSSNNGGSGGYSNGENNNSNSEINDSNNESNYNNDGETSTSGGSEGNSGGESNYSNSENNENNNVSNYRANDDDDNNTSEESGGSSNGENTDSSSESNISYYSGNSNERYNDDASDQTFDLNNCSTYSNYWLWDLNLSCQNSTSYDDCECTSAAMMLESGELQCPDGSESNPYCPRGCSICDTCLKLLGCAETRPENPFRTLFTLGLLWYAFAALLGVVLGIIAMTIHRRASQPTSMQQSLMIPSDDENVWLAPVD